MHFVGIGTLVNMALVVAGSLAGMLFGKYLPDRVRDIVMQAAGLVVLFLGLSGLLSAVFTVEGGLISTNHTMVIIISLIVGSALGELINIEKGLETAGNWLQKKLQRGEGGSGSRLAEGFCSCTILFCTGAMAIVGSLNDALLADPDLLYSKGIIDGMTSIIFASTMGVGVLLSAFGVGIYQGAFTALATVLQPFITDAVLAQMSAIGGLIIIGISFNLLGIKKMRVGNMLPAIFLPLLWHVLTELL